jgi:paraquat-inducible protein A
MRILLALLLVTATFSFALGATLPLLTVSRLWLLDDEPSLVEIVSSLWVSGEWLLAAIIGLFSLLLPASKLAYLHVVALGGGSSAIHRAMGVIARWSMLDVLLVAIVIFAAKTSGLASATTRPGLWFFAASAILTATASVISRRLEKSETKTDEEPPA